MLSYTVYSEAGGVGTDLQWREGGRIPLEEEESRE